jgi:transposase
MKEQFLSKFDRFQVERMRASTRDKEAFQKLSVLILLDMGKKYAEIVETLGIGLGTIGSCKQKFESEGLTAYLDKNYVPYTGKMSDDQLAQLDDEVSKGLYSTVVEVVSYIHTTFGIDYCERAVCAILHKLGFVYKKTSGIPCKVDLEEQEYFLEQLEPFLAEVDDDEVIYFIDGVHPQHNTRSSYAWIKRGEIKSIPTNSGRERLNLNGAMNAHQPGDVVIHESKKVDAESTIELCEKILLKNQDKAVINILCDNASYYSNQMMRDWLSLHPKMRFYFIPTYSPNLNLIERLWKFMRKKVINLHFYPKFKEFRQAILDFFVDIGQYKQELLSLMRHNFQRFSIPSKT